ncbi:hypothetical protein D3C75_988260 [compost metagenome]
MDRSRIEDGQHTVVIHRAPGEHAPPVVQVIGFTWRKCDRKMLPMHQVFTLGMPPVHGAPLGRIGIMLIEQVIFTFKKYQSIGVVDPIGRRHKMIFQPAGVLPGRFFDLRNRLFRF